MRLWFTGDDFKIGAQSYPLIPFLCDSRGNAVYPANDWLYRQAVIRRGRVQSSRTWQTYGRALYDYFAFLEANDIVWNDEFVRPSPVAQWRNWSLGLKDPVTQRPRLAHSTIAHRLKTICRFYEWAQRDGYLEKLPFTEELMIIPRQDRGDLLSHLTPHGGVSVKVNELSVRFPKKDPKILSLGDAKRFIDALATARERLMARVMLQTGMRRSEVTTFPMKYVIDPGSSDPRRGIKVRLCPEDMTIKYGRSRDIFISPPLMHRMWRYLVLTRTPLARLQKSKRGLESPRLFLNRHGDELCERSLNVSFRKASRRTGIQCNPHMLRHCYATYELRARKSSGDQNALMWVKERLGHRYLSSVMIYLHLIETLEDDVLNEFQESIDEMMQEKA